MLRTEFILPRLKISGNKIMPLILPADYHYLTIANDLIKHFKACVGRRRVELEAAIQAYEGDSLDYWIIRGLANILENQCIFNNNPPIDPMTLRATLFSQGPVTHKSDLFSLTTRWQVVAEASAQFNLTTQQVEETLFADLAEEKILLRIDTVPTPKVLIDRYNLEVARGLLYWAREVQVIVFDHYKTIFKYIKLFKLMHTIYPLTTSGYRIKLHGPISPFVSSTIRYGLQFAKFFPALLLGQKWQMIAQVHPPHVKQPLTYTLDEQTALHSHFKPAQFFDSQLEADFAAEFEAKYEGSQRQWILGREDEVLVVGDTVMIPDFSLTHRHTGRRALIEIIGFWHPQYLQRKLDKIKQAKRSDLILLLYKSANVSEKAFKAASSGEVLVFAKKPVLKTVLAAVEKWASPPIK